MDDTQLVPGAHVQPYGHLTRVRQWGQERIQLEDGRDYPIHPCLAHARDLVHGPHLHGYRGPVTDTSWREEQAWCEGVVPAWGFENMDMVERYLQ